MSEKTKVIADELRAAMEEVVNGSLSSYAAKAAVEDLAKAWDSYDDGVLQSLDPRAVLVGDLDAMIDQLEEVRDAFAGEAE